MPTKNSPTKNLVFATIAFAIAVVCWSGLVLANDPVGRIIFGSVWTLLGVGWLGRYFMKRKAAASESSADSRQHAEGAGPRLIPLSTNTLRPPDEVVVLRPGVA